MQNKIIIRYADGLVKKGTTQDFSTKKDVIHFKDNENGESLELSFKDLKAVFFVKDFNGNAKYQDKKMWRDLVWAEKLKCNSRMAKQLLVTHKDSHVTGLDSCYSMPTRTATISKVL